MKMMKSGFLSLGAVFLALSLTTTGCSEDDDEVTESGTAELRVVHASPDAPAVDIYAEGVATPLVSDLAYGQASSYLAVDEGSYNIQIRAAGSPATSSPVFETGPLALGDGVRVTAVAAGLLGSADPADRFRVLPLVEGFTGSSATAHVRIVHASADAPTVAIDVGDDGSAEIDALARFADTGAGGVGLPAGERLQIGIRSGGDRVTALTTPALPAGADLFVIATGLLGQLPRAADGFGLLAVGPDGVIGLVRQNPTVYALHASPDAPPVDLLVGDTLIAEDLAFGELSAPIQVPPGSYPIDFYPHQVRGTPAASAETPSLVAGQRYLAIASGFLGSSSMDAGFQLIATVDELAVDSDNTRLAVVHASPDAPAVDIGTVAGGVLDQPALIEDLDFAEAVGGEGLAIPPTTLTLGIAASGASDPVATFGISTTAGLRAIAVAAGALDPSEGDESFRLLLVVTSASPWQVAEVVPN